MSTRRMGRRRRGKGGVGAIYIYMRYGVEVDVHGSLLGVVLMVYLCTRS